MINNILKKIYDFMLPITSVWMILLYLRILNYCNCRGIVSNWILFFLFIPVIFFESLTGSLILHQRPIRLWPGECKTRILLSGKILFWFFIFLFWVIALPADTKGMELLNSVVVPLSWLVYRAESYLTIVAFILWMAVYYFITVKKRKFKIFNSLILPGILTYVLYCHFYYFGGVGECSPDKVSRQKGVEIFYGVKDFPKENYLHYTCWTKISRLFPMEIYVDTLQNAIYANYAKTHGKLSDKKTPNLLRIDLKTKKTKYVVSYYIRTFSANTATILVSPWFVGKIYELSKKDLSVIRTFPVQSDIDHWEATSIYHDPDKDYVYIATNIYARLFKYDYKTGMHMNHIAPRDIKYGGAMWNLQVSDKTGLMYVIALLSEDDVFEIDPETLDIRRRLDLSGYGGSSLGLGGSSLKLDDENGLLYFQDGGTDKLYEIDIDSFKVKRVLKGEMFAQRMHIDKKRKALYILSFLYGNLFALDLETGKRRWSIKVGGKPGGLAICNDTAYVNSMAGIVKIDLETVWREFKK